MIADLEVYLRDINQRFAGQHISVDVDWLTGCIEWFLSENLQISNEDLFKNAYEQWLLSNLVESGAKCLPQSVQHNKNEFEFTGNYALQMQFVIDVAESAYEQYRNIHNRKLDEAEDDETESRQRNVSKKRRTLKLELTDGHDTVIAMEHCPISCLNTKLCPGTKILVEGPMRCVNKVLFLRPGNVKILGGEVEQLAIENAYENILLKAMGRPITSTPKLDYKENVTVELNNPIRILPSVPTAMQNRQANPPPDPQPSRNLMDDDDDLFSNLDIDHLETNVKSPPIEPTHSTHVNHLLDDDDDIFLNANIPDVTVTEPTNRRQIMNHSFDDDDDDFDPSEIEANLQMEMQIENERLLANNKSNAANETEVRPTNNDEFFDSEFDDIFPSDYAIEDDTAKVSHDITDRNYEFKVNGMSLVTILQLHSIDDSDKSERSFVVKCEVEKVVKSIRIAANQYHLAVLLRDSTGMQLEVKISNDVIAQWTDVTAEELQKMRSTMNQRPQQRQQMENILKKLTDTIAEFDGFLKVDYSDNKMPEVTEVIDSTAEFEEMLRMKLAKGV